MQEQNSNNVATNCIIALGANLPAATGTAFSTLKQSLRLFAGESLRIRKTSNWYSTPAFPAGSGPNFVNAAVLVQTALSPEGVLGALQRIEHALGRTRKNRWEPRLCDLDLIAYGDVVLPDLDTFKHWQNLAFTDQKTQTPPELILPHPRLQDRAFVLIPLKDVAPDWCHPVSGNNVTQMIDALDQSLLVDISVL
ncbi:MAG: 2-amino-4-hydroxy-6-hydroxymethyldihydropteridine diphosphokinase [Paracoccaceae bacterium]